MSVFATGVLLAASATVWPKLDYVGDVALPHPHGKPASNVVVVVDAGHGGKDAGAYSCSGKAEKEVNLMLADDVASALTNLGYRVVMTRSDDRTVGLYERPAVGVMHDADAFISIHHNAPGAGMDPKQVRYRSVYAWNPLGDALAVAIANQLGCESMRANFAVTRNPEIPSCLVEADFITHPDGERAAWNASVRKAVAGRIAIGFHDWRTNATVALPATVAQ